jgi:DNA adenine methylase
MSILALAPWYGSKRTLAATVVEQLGRHNAYWEPLCGVMAVLLAKPRAAHESVNDLHRELMNLALVLQDRVKAQALYDRAGRTLFHQGLLELAKEKVAATQDEPPAADEKRAFWYLIHSWFSLSGVAGTPLSNTRSFRVRYTSGGNGVTHWHSVTESIPTWHKRLLNIEATCVGAFDVLAKIKDQAGVAIYCDPPYLRKGSEYKHEFAPEDHHRLAESLGRFKRARVVVSYYDDPLLGGLYPDWQRLGPEELGVSKDMVQGGRRDGTGKVRAPEVLLINGPLVGRRPAAGPL